ncbi:MAG: metallophosphoesterase [Syntrophomonadaceae bacterium]|nr:metallophosphoesterase [Syntrophomonadaceae bacterium]
MRIAAVSDTHGFTDNIMRELTGLPLDMLLFCGDHYRDGLKLARQLELPVYAVTGNCDEREFKAPAQEWLRLEGKKVWLLHGHQYNVKQGLDRLWYAAREKEADMVIFGHTHVAYCEEAEGIWLLNPGCAGVLSAYPGSGPSWALLELQDGRTDITIMKFTR